MRNNKVKGIKIQFVGQSANNVTGSMYQIKFGEYTILLDCGLYQNNNIVEDYKINHEKIKEVNPRNIDYIFISHANIDHFGKLPYLYKNGCNAKIFVPKGNVEIMKIMMTDSAKIMESDAKKLSNKHNINAHPLYTNDDVDICMEYIEECEYNEEIYIKKSNDWDFMFKFISAHHIVNSSQIILTIKDGNLIKKIGYTGDIGSPNIPKHYVEPLQNLDFCDVVIGECTYANVKRNHKLSDRFKDIEKIDSIVNQVCIENKGKVLFPVFSLDRLENILTELYKLFGDKKDFKTKILVDTPLGIRIANLWKDIISVDKELWEKVCSWENIVWVNDYVTSLSYQKTKEPQIILASSGMMNAGRSVSWAKCLIPNSNNHICFCGYSGENTLAQKIKDYKGNNYITIEGDTIPNKCNITTLNSFSSHMCHSELIKYYTELRYNKIYLVHSNMSDRKLFADELSKKNKTSKVICANNNIVCNL